MDPRRDSGLQSEPSKTAGSPVGLRVGPGLAVIASACLNAYAISRGAAGEELRYLVASVVASMPVIGLLTILVARRPQVGAPATTGLVAATALLSLLSLTSSALDPLTGALAAVVAVGVGLVLVGRARAMDIGLSVIVTYLAFGWIFEVSISLHSLWT